MVYVICFVRMILINQENYQSIKKKDKAIFHQYYFREAFRRVLTQLCGYINSEEWEKVCKM